VISMTMVGPRVCAAMAEEGFLPRALGARRGRPPVGSVLLQSGLSLLLLTTHGFEELLRSVGSILTLTSALTVAALVRMRLARRLPASRERPGWPVMVAATIFLAGSAWMLWVTLIEAPRTLLWLGVVGLAAAIAYVLAARRRRAAR